MNICSVTSCEDKTINLYLACNQLCKKQDFNVFIQPVRGWRWCHIPHTQALSLNVSQHYTRFFSNHSQPPMTHLSLNLQILEKQAAVSANYLYTTSCWSFFITQGEAADVIRLQRRFRGFVSRQSDSVGFLMEASEAATCWHICNQTLKFSWFVSKPKNSACFL